MAPATGGDTIHSAFGSNVNRGKIANSGKFG